MAAAFSNGSADASVEGRGRRINVEGAFSVAFLVPALARE